MMYSECLNSNPKNIPLEPSTSRLHFHPLSMLGFGWYCTIEKCLCIYFIRLFRSIYKKARAIHTHKGKHHILINFLSGVLQGCPASAFLFNNALDPFLTSFDKILRDNDAGIVRACADDMGISLRKLKHMHLIDPMYQGS